MMNNLFTVVHHKIINVATTHRSCGVCGEDREALNCNLPK